MNKIENTLIECEMNSILNQFSCVHKVVSPYFGFKGSLLNSILLF